MATHLSLYPAILIVPVILLLGSGLDTPPKLFVLKNSSAAEKSPSNHGREHKVTSQTGAVQLFSWRPVVSFVLWASIWSCYVLFLSTISLKGYDGLFEMFRKTHGFILAVEDLSPNIGVLWYFFAEVFDFFRSFFLMVFHLNILFVIFPLAVRLKHRPCFLAFVYIAISSMLKFYPSVIWEEHAFRNCIVPVQPTFKVSNGAEIHSCIPFLKDCRTMHLLLIGETSS